MIAWHSHLSRDCAPLSQLSLSFLPQPLLSGRWRARACPFFALTRRVAVPGGLDSAGLVRARCVPCCARRHCRLRGACTERPARARVASPHKSAQLGGNFASPDSSQVAILEPRLQKGLEQRSQVVLPIPRSHSTNGVGVVGSDALTAPRRTRKASNAASISVSDGVQDAY